MNLKKDQEMNKQFLGQIFIKIFSLILLEGIFIVAIASPINKGREYKTMPISEKSFIKIMRKALDEYTTTTNDVKKQKINFDLSKSVFNLLKDGSAKDWVGIISFINTDNSDGSAGLSITPLGEENSLFPITLATADSREAEKKFSIPNTRISIGTHLYDALSELEVGDKVVFSGHFIPSGVGILPIPKKMLLKDMPKNIPEDMLNNIPENIPIGMGIFKFTDIKKIQFEYSLAKELNKSVKKSK